VILAFALFILVLDMSSPGNLMSWIMSIEPLTRTNYPQWREKVNIGFALFEIDKAIMGKRPVKPTHEEIHDDMSHEVRAHKEKENAKLMECY
jgi:hypothetical protein